MASGLAVVLLSHARPTIAQSLADVARKEQARRESVCESGKVYTNADLTADDSSAPAATRANVPETMARSSPGAPAPVTASTGDADGVSSIPNEPGNSLDEASWRLRATSLRKRVARARDALATLSGASEGNSHQQTKMSELRATSEEVLGRAADALAAFEREAATLGVPAAWIR